MKFGIACDRCPIFEQYKNLKLSYQNFSYGLVHTRSLLRLDI